MFRHRRLLRRWAARMLLLWLFGVGAGVANACLAPRLAPADAAANSAPTSVEHHEHAVPGIFHTDASGQAGDEGTPAGPVVAHANCLDFCDRAGISIVPLKSVFDGLLGQALPASAPAVVVPIPAFVPARSWTPLRGGVSAAPIPIVFLRLAL